MCLTGGENKKNYSILELKIINYTVGFINEYKRFI